MSADNYLVVDHDGKTFLVGMAFMSDDDGPRRWTPCSTLEDVTKEIESYPVIEYGVDYTTAARLEMENEEMKELRAALKVERKVSAAMGQQQKALMAELAAKDAVVEHHRVFEDRVSDAMFTLNDDLRALDKPCPTCGEWDAQQRTDTGRPRNAD